MSASSMWNQRFSQPDYVYGMQPNTFLASQATLMKPGGAILSLGEGEGRNAVYLASKGLRVTALDSSEAGMAKLKGLASDRHVEVEEWLSDVLAADLGSERWDGIVNIYCHLPSASRKLLYGRIHAALRPGGLFLTEQFTPRQLAYTSGGPKDPDMLVTLEELRAAFPADEVLYGAEESVELAEGQHHQGTASVVRFIVKKH